MLKISCFIVIIFSWTERKNQPSKQAKKAAHFSAGMYAARKPIGFEMACIWHKSKTVEADCYFVFSLLNVWWNAARTLTVKKKYYRKLQLLIGGNLLENFTWNIWLHQPFSCWIMAKSFVVTFFCSRWSNINARHQIIEQIKRN